MFLRDSLAAIWDSGGLGVGFGKEAITNWYELFHSYVFTDPFNEKINFMYLSQHNSFVVMFYRLGIVGGAAFAWFLFVPAAYVCGVVLEGGVIGAWAAGTVYVGGLSCVLVWRFRTGVWETIEI